jgi:hypothetical protein
MDASLGLFGTLAGSGRLEERRRAAGAGSAGGAAMEEARERAALEAREAGEAGGRVWDFMRRVRFSTSS